MTRLLAVALVCLSMGSRPVFAREFDVETGLVHMGARDYGPETGRFLQEDPVFGLTSNPQSLNQYAYVYNRPTVMVDPFGLWGVGVGLGESTEVGLGPGYAQTGAVGAGVFWPGILPRGGFSAGGFSSWGGFSSAPKRTCPVASAPPRAIGVFGGGGLNVFLTNAANVGQLKDRFRSLNLNLGWGIRVGSIQYAYDDVGTWIVTYGGPIPGLPITGVGFWGSVSAYDTWTKTTK